MSDPQEEDTLIIKPIEIQKEQKKEKNYKGIILLVLLCIQNASEAILLRYVGGISDIGFDVQLLQFHSEILKFLITISIVAYNKNLCIIHKSSIYMIIPAVLYLIQNCLGYIGYKYVPIPVMAVLGQCKLISAAIFSIILLKKQYSDLQMKSLIQIIIGASVVVISQLDYHKHIAVKMLYALGLICTLVSFCLSGLTNVYIEKILKEKKTGVWIRNVQLSFFSIIILSISLSLTPGYEWGFFYVQQDPLYYVLVFLSSIGGILVALCLKYADAVLKSFSQSVSIGTG